MEKVMEMSIRFDRSLDSWATQGSLNQLIVPIAAAPEPEAPPMPEAPETRPEREAPRYPSHTPPAPDKCPQPGHPLPDDDEAYPACSFGGVARS